MAMDLGSSKLGGSWFMAVCNKSPRVRPTTQIKAKKTKGTFQKKAGALAPHQKKELKTPGYGQPALMEPKPLLLLLAGLYLASNSRLPDLAASPESRVLLRIRLQIRLSNPTSNLGEPKRPPSDGRQAN